MVDILKDIEYTFIQYFVIFIVPIIMIFIIILNKSAFKKWILKYLFFTGSYLIISLNINNFMNYLKWGINNHIGSSRFIVSDLWVCVGFTMIYVSLVFLIFIDMHLSHKVILSIGSGISSGIVLFYGMVLFYFAKENGIDYYFRLKNFGDIYGIQAYNINYLLYIISAIYIVFLIFILHLSLKKQRKVLYMENNNIMS